MTNYDFEEKTKWRDRLIYLGLACFIVAGLLILFHPASALEQFNASQPGERNIEDLFEFTMHNVSATPAQVTHHVTIYSSKLLQENQTPYLYWSVAYGQYFNQTPDKGKKWLFVWVRDWIDDIPVWEYDQDQFIVWVWGNTTINPEPVQMEDQTRNRLTKHINPAIIEGVSFGHPLPREYAGYGDPYGWKDGFAEPRIEPGQSNAWSGWIKYQVPEKATLQDIQVAGWFMNYGTPYWNLVPRNITQVLPIPAATVITIQVPQQQAVDRTGERPGAAVMGGRQRT